MPLFGHKPTPPARIVESAQAPLSKDQKAFNALVKKIEVRRARLAEWQAAVPEFRQRYVTELEPLRVQWCVLQRQFAVALDAAHDRKGVTKTEKRKLAVIVSELATELLQFDDDDVWEALLDKYSAPESDEEARASLDMLKMAVEQALRIDLGDLEFASEQELASHVQQHMEALEAQREAKEAPARKKTSQQLAREAKREAEAKQISLSLREVFRKLASALHPDREPDPVERARKTALMQRANSAYEAGNLLQLLELQLELEQIDQAHLANLPPERLKHYTKILKGQLADLEAEIADVEQAFACEFGCNPFGVVRLEQLSDMLSGDIKQCREDIASVAEKLAMAEEPAALKAWLKTLSLRRVYR